jgi:hypothetical protein
VLLAASAPAGAAQWTVIPRLGEDQPVCTVIVTPNVATGRVRDMRLRLVSRTGRDLAFDTLASVSGRFDLVAGDLRAPLSAFALPDTAGLAASANWTALRGANRIHMTTAETGADPLATARFDAIGFDDILLAMQDRCGVLLPDPARAAAEQDLDLSPQTLRLLNYAVFAVLDDSRPLSRVQPDLSEASRDRMARALRMLGAPPARRLDTAALNVLLGTLGIAVAPQFSGAMGFSGGVAAAEQDGRWGLIDTTGAWILQPVFDAAAPASAGVTPLQSGRAWRMVEASGAPVPRLRGDGPGLCDPAICRILQSGAVRYVARATGRIVSQGWQDGTGFDNGSAYVRDTRGWHRIDAAGVADPLPDLRADALAGPQAGILAARTGANWQLLRADTLRPYGETFDAVLLGGRRLVTARKGALWGLVNVTDGTFTAPPAFRAIGAFSRGLAPATRDGSSWGYIGRTGDWVLPPAYASAAPFSEGVAAVGTASGRMTLIDTRGRVLLPDVYDEIGQMSDGLAPVRTGPEWGYLAKERLGATR